jgi:hypothetical protein
MMGWSIPSWLRPSCSVPTAPPPEPSPTRGEREDGQTLIVFTLVCAFVLLGTVALVGNLQVLFVNDNRADAAALLAAQAGASAISESALYSNDVQLDPSNAPKRCHDAGSQVPNVVSVDCKPSPDLKSITATVTERVTLPLSLWGSTETIQATRTARPAFGGHTGGFPAS